MPQDCDRGDSVMADKRFDVEDIFAPYGVNIPTCFKEQPYVSKKNWGPENCIQKSSCSTVHCSSKNLQNNIEPHEHVRNPDIIRYNICVFYVVQFLFIYRSCLIMHNTHASF